MTVTRSLDSLHELLPSLTTFVAVVEAGGFASAARRLGVTRSAVSKHVARLEDAWGVKLLRRSTRAVSLTESGAEAYEHARQIPHLFELAEQSAATLNRTPRGLLRVTASVSFGQHRILSLLPGFRTRFPEVSVELHLLDRIVDLVDEGMDVAVRLSSILPQGMIATELSKINYILCASPSLVGAEQCRSPRDLYTLPHLRLCGRPAREGWRFSSGELSEDISLRASIAANTSDALKALCLAAQGVALLPDYVCSSEIANSTLVQVLPAWTAQGPYGDHCWAVRAPEARLTPKVAAFIGYLADNLR